MRNKVSKLEGDLRRRDDLLSQNIAEAVRDGRIKCALFEGQEGAGAREVMLQMEGRIRGLETEGDMLKHELQVREHVLHHLEV